LPPRIPAQSSDHKNGQHMTSMAHECNVHLSTSLHRYPPPPPHTHTHTTPHDNVEDMCHHEVGRCNERAVAPRIVKCPHNSFATVVHCVRRKCIACRMCIRNHLVHIRVCACVACVRMCVCVRVRRVWVGACVCVRGVRGVRGVCGCVCECVCVRAR
jgi:hypothetical protein